MREPLPTFQIQNPIWGCKRATAATALLAALLLSNAAAAAVIQGSFVGIAFNSRVNAEAPWHSNFDGRTMTGRFWFDPYDQPINGPDEIPGTFHARSGSMWLECRAVGQTVSFDTEFPSFVDYKTNGTDEHLSFSPSSTYPYYHATLTLAGPLFANDGFDSLHAAPIDLAHSWASFFAGRSLGADVRLTRVAFDQTSIPEPSELALVLGGLSSSAICRRAFAKKK